MPTPVFHNSTEGYSTSPTTVTQGSGGNSGAGSGDYWDTVFLNSGTATAVNAAKKHRAFGYRLTRSGTSQIYFQKVLAADITDFVGQHWAQIPTQPSANHVVFKGYSDAAASVTSWGVAINTTGKLLVLAGSGSTTVYTGTTTIPAAVDVRWEYEVVSATSIRVVAYSGDSNTVLADSGVVSTALVGVTRAYRTGLLTTTSSPASIDLDDVTYGSGPGLFGLASTATPTTLVSNAGAWVTYGGGSIPANLSDAVSTTGAESVSAGSAVAFRVNFGDQILPEGAVTLTYKSKIDSASPDWTLLVTAYQGGVSKGTQTVTISGTTEQSNTFTITGLSGDMSTLEVEFTGTTQ